MNRMDVGAGLRSRVRGVGAVCRYFFTTPTRCYSCLLGWLHSTGLFRDLPKRRRCRRSGPTVPDKEFYLDAWDDADSAAVMRFGYLTDAMGRNSGVFWLF